MATLDDVRRIARALPETVEGEGQFGFAVRNKGSEKAFVWSWKERVHPKKGRIENLEVLAVRVADQDEKEMLLAADPAQFFTEPHYNGYPAVLVRLAAIDAEELGKLLVEAWRCMAPKALVQGYDKTRMGEGTTA